MVDAPTPTPGGIPAVPGGTYRLQLGPDLDFAAASELVEPLAALGVTHLYLSPVCRAAPGSTHGYDVADPREIAPELGGEDGLRALSEQAARHGLGLVVDVVPNHMAAHTANPHWAELLRSGRSGAAGDVFDVDWSPAVPGLEDKVILPVLGDRYGVVLEQGELRLVEEDGTAALAYYDHRFPLSASSREGIDRAGGVEAFAGEPGDAASFARLHAVVEAQHYRLVHWRVGDRLVNYRRFFTITDLAAVRVEVGDVFDLVHGTLLRLVEDGVVHGLRIDHPDGLADPGRYFADLAAASGGVWTVAEKITHPGEELPAWPVAGTTGYEFCNDVLGVLGVDPRTEGQLTELDEHLGAPAAYTETALEGKREMLRTGLASDTDRLARLLWRVTQEDAAVRDVALDQCRDAIVGIATHIDVYRPYVDPRTGAATAGDRAVVARAVAAAREAGAAPGWLLDFAGEVVCGDVGSGPAHLALVGRFPQLTSAAVAKGTEDTAFYRYRRLLALNEVGGEPGRFGVTLDDFHRENARRAERHPTAMLTTATHDTKRGEDTRLRMAAVSELADDWDRAARGWASGIPGALDGQVATLVWQTMLGVWPLAGRPDGAWRDRVVAYLEKAEREAAQRTTWTDQDTGFESALGAYVDALLVDDRFLATFTPLAGRAAEIAMVTGLGQTLLRCTSPGVPDTYQGMEVWDDHLVDPDNRRPVDWEGRRRLITGLPGQEIDPAGAADLWESRRDGRVKAHVLACALRLRRDRPELFASDAGYAPAAAQGPQGPHLVAFSRGPGDPRDHGVVVMATRLPGSLEEDGTEPAPAWADTIVDLPEGSFRDVLTGATHPLGAGTGVGGVLATLPVALLVREG